MHDSDNSVIAEQLPATSMRDCAYPSLISGISGFTAKSICGGQGDYCFAVGTDGKPYRTTDPNPLA